MTSLQVGQSRNPWLLFNEDGTTPVLLDFPEGVVANTEEILERARQCFDYNNDRWYEVDPNHSYTVGRIIEAQEVVREPSWRRNKDLSARGSAIDRPVPKNDRRADE